MTHEEMLIDHNNRLTKIEDLYKEIDERLKRLEEDVSFMSILKTIKGQNRTMDNYSQGIQDNYNGPYIVIIKNGLPMSDDDIQEDLEEMQKRIKQLEAENKRLKEKVENLENEIKDYLGQHDSSDQ